MKINIKESTFNLCKFGMLSINIRHATRGEAGGARPPHFLPDQKAPPGSGGAPHYYRPPRIFDPCNTPVKGNVDSYKVTK